MCPSLLHTTGAITTAAAAAAGAGAGAAAPAAVNVLLVATVQLLRGLSGDSRVLDVPSFMGQDLIMLQRFACKDEAMLEALRDHLRQPDLPADLVEDRLANCMLNSILFQLTSPAALISCCESTMAILNCSVSEVRDSKAAGPKRISYKVATLGIRYLAQVSSNSAITEGPAFTCTQRCFILANLIMMFVVDKQFDSALAMETKVSRTCSLAELWSIGRASE